MTAGSYGPMRATDADRENVRTILTNAHAEGRLSWPEFDTRSTALLNAQTYDQLGALTADLPTRIPAVPPQIYQGTPGVGGPGTTNGMAIAALVCGIVQFAGFWLLGTIPAIVFGHVARKQIRQTGEQGAGLALAGMILGYVGLALSIIGAILFTILVAWSVHHVPTGPVPGPAPPGGY